MTLRRTAALYQRQRAIAIDAEFLKCDGKTLVRSVAFVPFWLKGSIGDTGIGCPPSASTAHPTAGRAIAVHLAPDAVMASADVLPTGWALDSLLKQDLMAQRCFAGVAHPFAIPNPIKHRSTVRRLVVAALQHDRQAVMTYQETLRCAVAPFLSKQREFDGLESVLSALGNAENAAPAANVLDTLCDRAKAVARGQTSFNAAQLASVLGKQASSNGMNVVGAPSAVFACSLDDYAHKIADVVGKMQNVGAEVPLVAFGKADEGALNSTLLAATNSSSTARPRVLDLHEHVTFGPAMNYLGVRRQPKLIEAVEALAACGDVGGTPSSATFAKETAAFLSATGGVNSNHTAMWDAQALALLTSFVQMSCYG